MVQPWDVMIKVQETTCILIVLRSRAILPVCRLTVWIKTCSKATEHHNVQMGSCFYRVIMHSHVHTFILDMTICREGSMPWDILTSSLWLSWSGFVSYYHAHMPSYVCYQSMQICHFICHYCYATLSSSCKYVIVLKKKYKNIILVHHVSSLLSISFQVCQCTLNKSYS